MARSKVTVRQTTDFAGIPCVEVSCKKGKLNIKDIYEAVEKEGLFGLYLMQFNISEDVPEDLYEEGDAWCLYEPQVLMDAKTQEALEDKYNEGYEDGRRDYECLMKQRGINYND